MQSYMFPQISCMFKVTLKVFRCNTIEVFNNYCFWLVWGMEYYINLFCFSSLYSKALLMDSNLGYKGACCPSVFYYVTYIRDVMINGKNK